MQRAHPSAAALLLILAAPVYAQQGIEGTWVTDAFGAPNLFDLQQNGNRVTGTISRAQEVFTIYDGSIEGDVVTFKAHGVERLITFTGRLNGNEMSFTRSIQVLPGGTVTGAGIVGAVGPTEFVARRDVSGGAMVPRGFFGNWQLNLQRSTFDPGPTPQLMVPSVASVVSQPDGRVGIAYVSVVATGTPTVTITSLKLDGQEYPLYTMPTLAAYLTVGASTPITLSARAVDPMTIEFTRKSNGVVLYTSRMSLSEDGNTLSERMRSVGQGGELVSTNTWMWERIIPTPE